MKKVIAGIFLGITIIICFTSGYYIVYTGLGMAGRILWCGMLLLNFINYYNWLGVLLSYYKQRQYGLGKQWYNL